MVFTVVELFFSCYTWDIKSTNKFTEMINTFLWSSLIIWSHMLIFLSKIAFEIVLINIETSVNKLN